METPSEFEYPDGPKKDAPAGTRTGQLKPWQHFRAKDAMAVAGELTSLRRQMAELKGSVGTGSPPDALPLPAAPTVLGIDPETNTVYLQLEPGVTPDALEALDDDPS
jgi:hypothetical protein